MVTISSCGTSRRVIILLSWLDAPSCSLMFTRSLLVTRKCITFMSEYEYGSFIRARAPSSMPFTYPVNCFPSE